MTDAVPDLLVFGQKTYISLWTRSIHSSPHDMNIMMLYVQVERSATGRRGAEHHRPPRRPAPGLEMAGQVAVRTRPTAPPVPETAAWYGMAQVDEAMALEEHTLRPHIHMSDALRVDIF